MLLEVLDVTVGSDWTGGVYEGVWDNSIGQAHFGGVVVSPGLSGPCLHLFNITFRVLPSSATTDTESQIVTTVEHLSAYGVSGQTIGSPTPHISLSGTVPIRIVASREAKRSVRATTEGLLGKKGLRQKRQDPSSCGLLGDADGSCSFDLRDVACATHYISEGLLGYTTPQGTAVADKIANPTSILDVNRNGVVDWNDILYMLAANFDLFPFVEDIAILPVQSASSQCQFGISLSLVTSSGSGYSDAAVFMDVGLASQVDLTAFLLSFNSTMLTPVVTRSVEPFGVILEVEPGAQMTGMYSLSFPLQLNSDQIGISFVVIASSSSSQFARLKQLHGLISPIPRYSNTASPYTLNGMAILTPSGYNPLLVVANTLTSSDCANLELGPAVDVSFTGPREAVISWAIVNLNPDVHSPESISLYIYECPQGTNAGTASVIVDPLSLGCVERIEGAERLTNHTTAVRPYTDYRIQVRTQVSQSEYVLVTSPEDGELWAVCRQADVCVCVCVCVFVSPYQALW